MAENSQTKIYHEKLSEKIIWERKVERSKHIGKMRGHAIIVGPLMVGAREWGLIFELLIRGRRGGTSFNWGGEKERNCSENGRG